MSKKNNKRLGKGIEALLGQNFADINQPRKKALVEKIVEQAATSATPVTGQIAEIPLTSIEANPNQPRKLFDPERLAELSQSIKTYGLVQPLTVRSMGGDTFQLIAGERRFRAAKLAGLEKVPVYVKTATETELLEMALLENIQRENLNSMEIAITYQLLIEECALTHDELSMRMGKERSTITNYLRLLKLPPEIQEGIKAKKISMGHARSLLGLESNIGLQLNLYKEILAKKLSVRAVEEYVKELKMGPMGEKAKKVPTKLPVEYQKLQDELSEQFETKVRVKYKKKGKGELTIPFLSEDDLNRILDILR